MTTLLTDKTAIFLEQIERHYGVDQILAKVLARLLEEEESVDPDDLHTAAMEKLRSDANDRGGRLDSDERSEILDEIYAETFGDYAFSENNWGRPHEFNGSRYVAEERVANEIAEERCRSDIESSIDETWFLRDVVSKCWENGTSKDDYIEQQLSDAMDNYLGDNVDTFDVGRTTYYVWDM